MVKMIIVEDEPLMNEYLSNCLEWHKFGILLCGVFYNGQTAYDFLQSNSVDIVVTDIKMPVMDGLTLIKQLSSEQTHLKFIIVSSYNDFHMVKDAFKLGVSDYILKTEFEPETFQEILIRLIEGLSPSYEANGISPAMREMSLRQYFWGSVGSRPSVHIPGFYAEQPHEIAVLRILNYETVITDQWNTEKELMKYGLSNCIEELLEKPEVGVFFFNTYDEIIFFFSAAEQQKNKALASVIERLYTVMQVHFGLAVACGICSPERGVDQKQQYQRAVAALEYTFICGLSEPIRYDAIIAFCDTPNTFSLFQQAESAVKAFDNKTVMQCLETAKQWQPSTSALNMVKEFYKKLLLLVLSLSGSYGVEMSRSFEVLTRELWTAQDYIQTICELCSQLFGKKTHLSVMIDRVCDYIKKNYARNITLQLLAKEFHFDYTDLSRRFHQVTGKSFRQFLTEVRLNEAMELIQTTDFKLVEIASMVGYNNYENFNRSFKKEFKKSPNEIRKAET